MTVLRLRFVGHATLALELAGCLLLTDPLLLPRVAFLRRDPPAPEPGSFAAADAVLVSHLHQDHCDLRSLALLGRHRRLLVPGGTAPFFRRHGFTRVEPMWPGRTAQVGAVAVTATPAEHDGRRRPFGPCAPAVGFVVAGGGVRAYFAGDTDLFDAMAGLGSPLDVALLPVAGWGRTLGPGHLDPARAAEAVSRLRPALAVPIHWGSLHPLWSKAPARPEPALAFDAEVRRRSLPARVQVVPPGGEVCWPPGG